MGKQKITLIQGSIFLLLFEKKKVNNLNNLDYITSNMQFLN